MGSDNGYDGGLTCALSCSDLDASLKWYQEVLGFTLLYLRRTSQPGEEG